MNKNGYLITGFGLTILAHVTNSSKITVMILAICGLINILIGCFVND